MPAVLLPVLFFTVYRIQGMYPNRQQGGFQAAGQYGQQPNYPPGMAAAMGMGLVRARPRVMT